MTPTAQRPVFISYASEDFAAATRLRTALESSDIPCWIAPRDIEPGTSFPAAIRAALTSCGAVVLLLTASSNNSPHVLSEIELAFNERRPILPVLVAGVVPSENLRYFISTSQWFDAEGEFDDDDIARLREYLRKLLAGERIRIEQARNRRRLVWGAVAALVIAAIGTAAYVLRMRNASPLQVPPKVIVRDTPKVEPEPDTRKPANESERMRTMVNPRDGETYVWVAPGLFTMGCSAGDSRCEPDEMPAHPVRLNKGFWLARTEVTSAQFLKVRGVVRLTANTKDASAPVVGVTWQEAKDYCAAVGGRLPSEAEWEYAARAGSATSYYDALDSIAWYEENSSEQAHRVGSKAANAFGLHDMLGNAYEWVRDRYYNEYDEEADDTVEEPLLPNASAVARGGAWTSGARDVRVSNRLALPPDAAEPNVGFRCASPDE